MVSLQLFVVALCFRKCRCGCVVASNCDVVTSCADRHSSQFTARAACAHCHCIDATLCLRCGRPLVLSFDGGCVVVTMSLRCRCDVVGNTQVVDNDCKMCGDHTEVIELDYDPKTVTFEDLLDIFWANHEYGLTTKLKRQYQSMILYHDEEQRNAAEASYKQMQERCKEQLRTEIAASGTFYPAEDYHQKYRLQGHKDLCHSLGIDSLKLQTSHLAARLNGYLVGVGGKAQFEAEVARLGLNEKQADYVRRELDRNEGGGLAC